MNCEYKHYKIVRLYDGFTSYCNVLNYLESHFIRLFGMPETWIESDQKAMLKLRNKEIELPMKVNVVADDEAYSITLCKEEVSKVELKSV